MAKSPIPNLSEKLTKLINMVEIMKNKVIEIFRKHISIVFLGLIMAAGGFVGVSIGEGNSPATGGDIGQYKIAPNFTKGDVYRYQIVSESYSNLKKTTIMPGDRPEYVTISEVIMDIIDVGKDGSAEISFYNDTGVMISYGVALSSASGVGEKATIKLLPDGEYTVIDGELSNWINLMPILLYSVEEKLVIGEPFEREMPSFKMLVSAEGIEKINKYNCLKVIAEISAGELGKLWLSRSESSQYYMDLDRNYLLVELFSTSINEEVRYDKKKTISGSKVTVNLMEGTDSGDEKELITISSFTKKDVPADEEYKMMQELLSESPESLELQIESANKELEVLKVYSSGLDAYEAARENLDEQLLNEAIAKFQEAIKIDPEYSEALQKIGEAYLLKSRIDPDHKDEYLSKANDYFDKAVKLDPDLNFDQQMIKILYRDVYKTKREEAREYYSKALDYQIWGLKTKNRDDFVESIKLFQGAIDLDKSYTEAYDGIGRSYISLKEYQKAIEVLQRGLEYEPESVDLRLTLLRAYDRSGDKESAKIMCREILNIEPDNGKALQYLENM
jgi:tetratricopeptide (TPR) repeat protein